MVKGDTELKVFHSMVKYNDMFATTNLIGSVIGFIGGRTLYGSPWVFKTPRDRPWAWPEVEYVDNAIEMQGHFRQEGNNKTLWDMAGYPTKTNVKFPRLAMVTYAMVEWLVQENRTPNELRMWIENQEKDEPNFQKYDWELFKKFVVALGQVDESDKKISMLALDVETETATYEVF